jgi:hypothetical protein
MNSHIQIENLKQGENSADIETISKSYLEHDKMFLVSIAKIKESFDKCRFEEEYHSVVKAISLVLSEL